MRVNLVFQTVAKDIGKSGLVAIAKSRFFPVTLTPADLRLNSRFFAVLKPRSEEMREWRNWQTR